VVVLSAHQPASVYAAGEVVDRYSGGDRYATAAAISAETFEPGVRAAFVAVGSNFPDALAGAAAAAAHDSPMLLVTPTSIPSPTAAELQRLAPRQILVLGATGAVSAGVEAALDAYTTGSVVRLAGADRYATAAAISAATYAPGASVAYVAVGTDFPDALAGAAAAGRAGGPVLLVEPDSVPPVVAAELARLAPSRIVVLGASGAVSSRVESALRSYTAGPVERLAGADRYATAVAISQRTYGAADTVYLATGENFPDALAGAALQGPLLMTPATTLPSAVRAEIVRLGATRVVVLGGPGVVSTAVANAAAGLSQAPPATTWTGNYYDAAAVRWQQPNLSACTAASTMMMLNMIALGSPSKGDGFVWTPSVSDALQDQILAWSRQNMTMVTQGTTGTDPHGWRNALNYFGWGSTSADVYRDQAYADFDEALRAAIVGLARYGKPTGVLTQEGRHAQLIHGWNVTGDDPATGSMNFTVNGVYLTNPWEPSGLRNYYASPAALGSASGSIRFTPYLETDSPYPDPIDGTIGRDEWYGRYVIIVAVR
jgi:putative cell wall-binding protein